MLSVLGVLMGVLQRRHILFYTQSHVCESCENLALSREVVFRAIFRHGGLVWKKLCITIYPMSTSNSFMKKKTTFDRGKPVKNHRLIGSTLCSKAAGVCLGYWRLWAFVSNEAYGQYLWITTCKKHSLEVILGGVVL